MIYKSHHRESYEDELILYGGSKEAVKTNTLSEKFYEEDSIFNLNKYCGQKVPSYFPQTNEVYIQYKMTKWYEQGTVKIQRPGFTLEYHPFSGKLLQVFYLIQSID